jgi:hypothetical protein
MQLLGKSLVYHLLMHVCQSIPASKIHEITTSRTECAAFEWGFVLLLGKSLVHPLLVHAGYIISLPTKTTKQQQLGV